MKFSYIFVLTVTAIGCGSSPDSIFGSSESKTCEPGRSVNCVCSDGQEGAQICMDDGSGYWSCQCGSTSASTSGSGGSGGGSGSSSGGSGGGSCIPHPDCSVAVECGSVPDGCGGEYVCGTCDESHYFVCGGAPPNVNGAPGTGTPFTCGFVCDTQYDYHHPGCNGVGYYNWSCSIEGTNPPQPGCYPASNQVPTKYWCCTQNQ